jgi:hypothetical protein
LSACCVFYALHDFHCRVNNVRFSVLEYLPAKCKSCNELRLKIAARINKLSSVIFPTIAPSETGRRTTVAFRARVVPDKERLPTTGLVGDVEQWPLLHRRRRGDDRWVGEPVGAGARGGRGHAPRRRRRAGTGGRRSGLGLALCGPACLVGGGIARSTQSDLASSRRPRLTAAAGRFRSGRGEFARTRRSNLAANSMNPNVQAVTMAHEIL